MTSLKEKQILALDWAKVHANQLIQNQLESKYAQLEVSPMQQQIVVKVLLYQKVRKYFDKQSLEKKIKQIFAMYCPSFKVKVLYTNASFKAEALNPKTYFQRIKDLYKRFKMSPFNSLTRLETQTLYPGIEGLRVVVKGKRGVQKFMKGSSKGNVCFHSLKPDVLKRYKGILKTNLGIMGITVSLKIKP